MRARFVLFLVIWLCTTNVVWADAAPPTNRAAESWPTWHITALPDEGHCVPYDANGAIFWKGKYHLMYIFQDRTRPNGGHCWGHLSSTDLVNWTFHPTALAPNKGDADTGIFSGNAFVNKEGVPMLCWLGLDAGVCVATAEDDDLIRWKKHPKNPIIGPTKPGQPGHGEYIPWDPYLWLEGDTYYCIIGNVHCKQKPPYLLKSTDLTHWKPLHAFYDYPDRWIRPDDDCSCPDFFQLGDRRVLMCISHLLGARCYVGRFENEKFLPDQYVRMNWPGSSFFAPESLVDSQGRRIFWAWVIDPRLGSTKNATGSGFMSMPRVLSLAEDKTLRITPATELETLRRNPRTIAKTVLRPNTETVLPNLAGDSLELSVEIDPGQSQEVGLKVRCSPDGNEETAITYDAVGKKLKLDMSRSTLRNDVVYQDNPLKEVFYNDPRKGPQPVGAVEAPFELKRGETLKLRVFLDKAMLEVFANDRQCVTQQIYPASREALGVKAFARGGEATIRSGAAWNMAPATFVDRRKSANGGRDRPRR
jgi:beta-fructofuranosidase